MLKLLTVAEVAQLLRLSPATIYALVRRGQLTACRIGVGRGVIRIEENELDRYLGRNAPLTFTATQQKRTPTRVRLKHIRLIP